MKSTTATANTWTFAPTSATVNGKTYPASYSLTRSGDVYVFTGICAPDGTNLPTRIHVAAGMPMHAEAVAAAKAETPAAKAEAPAPVQDAPKPAAAKADHAPAAKAETPAPAQDKPAPVDAPKPAKARKAAAPIAAAKAEPAPAAKAEAPAPVQDAPKPAASATAKPWIGTTITGKGWNIAFDEQTQRTRVLFQAQPTDAQKAAIEKAGFFWSAQLCSWNKKLTCKAYRAAQELATALNALA